MSYITDGVGAESAQANNLIAFGKFSQARRVSIFRTTAPMAAAGIISCRRTDSVSAKLCPSDSTRIGLSEGWLSSVGLSRLVLTAYLSQN